MKKKKKMDGPEADLVARVIGSVSRACVVDYVEMGDDDVFSDTDVYSDMQSSYPKGAKPQTAEDVKRALANETRPRRASDVIDSLGEELVTMRVHGSPSSDPFSIPVSPRSRISSDLGYSGSFASSPATTHFNFPSSVSFSATSASARRCNNNTTDSRPIEFNNEKECKQVLEARMPVARDAEAYNMSHPRRGRAVILNNDVFDGNIASARKGSAVDVLVLEETFNSLGFQVDTFHNLTYHEIKDVVQNLSQEDHSDADCIALIVLTHGLDNGLLYARDNLYRVESLWVPFTAENCTTLAGKPKLFFVQACRGQKLDAGVSLVSQRRSMSETDSGCASYKVPSYADFLISFSSMDGFYSWRNPEDGTWFIQSLVMELKAHGTTRDLSEVLTRVHRRVALLYESNVQDLPWMHQQKQCPIYHSSLMRDLVFIPKP